MRSSGPESNEYKNMNADYRGVHLESNLIRNYNPVGVLGKSVYQTAGALREILQRHDKSTGTNLALYLAIPQSNNNDTAIDWYADSALSENESTNQTNIVNWNQASLEERKVAFEKIKNFEKAITQLSIELKQKSKSESSDQFTFSQLLPKTLYTPTLAPRLGQDSVDATVSSEPVHIFLVGQEQFPVLTFWGFTHPKTPADIGPLDHIARSLIAPPVQAIAPTPTTDPVIIAAPLAAPIIMAETTEKTSWWRWLRWLLLALLLILLMLLLLRSCISPSAQLPTLPTANLPTLNSASERPVDRSLFGMPLPKWMPSWIPGTGPSPTALNVGSSGQIESTEKDLLAMAPTAAQSALAPDLTSDPITPPTPPTEQLTPAIDSSAINQPATEASAPTPPTPDDLMAAPTAASLGSELAIPPATANQAMPQYLDGKWQASAIQDQKTGRSVRLKYDLENGAGTVQIQQSNGTQCVGSVQAAGQAGGLIINNTSQPQCSDGSSYEMPQIECRLNASQETECFGRYDNQLFPISMRQATQ